MIIFLYGTDKYRLYQNRDAVISSYRAKHSSGMNLVSIDGGSSDAADDLENSIKSQSFFSEVKLIILNGLPAKEDERIAELVKQYHLEEEKGTVVLVIHASSLKDIKHKPLSALLASKKNLVREFEPLSGVMLANWLKKEAVARNTPFQSRALNKFISLGGDSWQMMLNLEKLAHYARGPITEEIVAKLITAEEEPNIFQFIESLSGNNTRHAIDLLYRELAYGRDPYYVLTMVIYQFRNLLAVKDLSSRGLNQSAIAKQAAIHPFVVRKLAGVANRYTLEALKQIYARLLNLDTAAKNGTQDLNDALFVFAFSLA